MRVLRSKLSPGMILEEGAVDRDGRMLIGAHVQLSDRLIKTLETARIPIVYITDTSYEEFKTCVDLPILTDAQERAIRERFQHVNLEGQFAKAVFEETLNHARECLVDNREETQ